MDPDGREDDFSDSQIQEIKTGKNKALQNLDYIISALKNYGNNTSSMDESLSENAMQYLNYNLNNDSDLNALISNLSLLQEDLSRMSLSDFIKADASMNPDHPEWAAWTAYGRKYIYLRNRAFGKDAFYGQSLDCIIIHEESHKVLGTKDFMYDYGTKRVEYYPGTQKIKFGRLDELRNLPASKKRLNADNWRMFYFKVGI